MPRMQSNIINFSWIVKQIYIAILVLDQC